MPDTVEQLSIFQRTAQWMFPNPMYHDGVGEGVRWAMNHLPCYGRWYRFLVMWPGADKDLDAARVDPTYPNQDYAVSEVDAAARRMFTDWITNQVNDEALLANVLLDCPATGKRTLQDNGSWLRTLQRHNVELVRTPIRGLTAHHVVTADGVTREADVIVYASGSRHTDVLWPMKILGRNGIDLHLGQASLSSPRHHRDILTSRTPTVRSTPSARGDSTSIGQRCANLTGRSSWCTRER